jgi:sterol 3beta-glucosyltransferase
MACEKLGCRNDRRPPPRSGPRLRTRRSRNTSAVKIAVLASGSRGDVQPAVAVSAALAARGHATRLVAPENFAALTAGRGADFHPLPFDSLKEINNPENKKFFLDGANLSALLRWMEQAGRKVVHASAPAALEGARGADLIVGAGLMEPLGATLAERFQVPCVHAWWTPMLAARDFLFTSAETAPPRLPGWVNRTVFVAFDQALWLTMRRVLRPARELYELPAAPFKPPLRCAVARGETLLLAYSEALLPRSREWPANVERTGCWFLADSPTPIFVGFGSMAFRDRDASLDAVLRALARVGARGRQRRLEWTRSCRSATLRLRTR